MGTLNYIEPIYLGMKNNPRGLTPGQQMRACYDSHNVADGKGMSDDEFQAMLDDPMYHPSSPDALVCYYDPTGALGITAEQAAQADANKSSQPAVTVTAPSTPSGK
ncbi:MAG: hypothetical protein FWF43_04370 [Propionibacteriaceae bacterium]|nr:hypothetical protein [Propionibacteriaceae bacterium]